MKYGVPNIYGQTKRRLILDERNAPMEQNVPPPYCDKHKGMPQNRASPLHVIFEFYFTPHFCHKISFPTLPVLSAPAHSHRISGFQAQGIGRRNNDGLRQLNFVWILVLFLAGHSVLPQQQDLSGSTQSFSRSFPAIQSQQTLALYPVGAQTGFQRAIFFIELLSHPFPSGVFTRKARTK